MFRHQNLQWDDHVPPNEGISVGTFSFIFSSATLHENCQNFKSFVRLSFAKKTKKIQINEISISHYASVRRDTQHG
jgi:hypothetical protein